MSKLIGYVSPRSDGGGAKHAVYASVGGVETHSEPLSSLLDPCDARTMAALLERAADEVERMRLRARVTAQSCLCGVGFQDGERHRDPDCPNYNRPR